MFEAGLSGEIRMGGEEGKHRIVGWRSATLEALGDEPEALLCKSCYNDLAGRDNLALDMCRKFSARNGFGPVPRPDVNAVWHRLPQLLGNATFARSAQQTT